MTNVEKFLICIAQVIQLLEDAQTQMLYGFNVDDAVGDQLALIGKLVGRRRDGIDDDNIYRRYVRAQIATNKSKGTAEDLITVCDLVVYDVAAYYHIGRSLDASASLIIEDAVVTTEIALIAFMFLQHAIAAGTRLVLSYWPLAEALMFTCTDGGGLGWSSIYDASVGGGMAGAMETT